MSFVYRDAKIGAAFVYADVEFSGAPASGVASVSVSPGDITILGGAVQTFVASVAGPGSPSQAVTWETDIGSIDVDGALTPPDPIQTLQVGIVRATSVQDPEKWGFAIFRIPALAGEGSISDADFEAWLESDDAIPNVLVEAWPLVDGVPTLITWSTLGYTPAGTDSPVFYEPAISTGIPYTEALSLSLASGATIAASDLEIDNTNGIREVLKSYVWTNRPIGSVVGDIRWGRADYRTMYAGVTAGLSPKDDRNLALHLRDMTQKLDAPMTELKLGGDGPNQDQITPLAFGECHNPAGQLTELLKRRFHDGPIEAIKRVRANALPVDFTEDVSTASCDLSINNQGAAITASVQGDKFGGVYRTTIGALVQRIVTGYGKEVDRYTEQDLDAANLAAFDAAHPQPVGLYLSERTPVLVACDMLASSLGAQLSPARDGKLRLIQIALPAAGVSTDIRPHHIALNSLRPVQHMDPVAAMKLGFCRNWTVQTGLTTAISDAVRDLFETEWLTETAVDDVRQAQLKLEGDPVQRNTMLLRRVDARAEAERLLALWGPGRDVYEFQGLPPMMMLELGQPVTIYNELYGMEGGKIGQVVSLTPDWKTLRVVVRILV